MLISITDPRRRICLCTPGYLFRSHTYHHNKRDRLLPGRDYSGDVGLSAIKVSYRENEFQRVVRYALAKCRI